MKFACLGLVAAFSAFSARPAFSEELPFGEELLVDLKDDTDDDDERALEELLGGIDLRLNSIHAEDERFFVADVSGRDVQALIDAIKNDPRVENVEPNYVYEMSMKPNDPMFDKQWSFKMVGAERAWERANGKGVVVAVIDTGVAFEDYKKFKRVEDLAGTKFVEGYDFVKDTEHPNDDHGHGTHVAGTIAQSTNNKRGVAGLAFGASIMPLKVLDRSGRGTAADIADAIRFAADEGAKVINMSLGGGMRSLTMESAVAYARKKGVVVICAAGNNSRGTVEYPAAYPGAFAVSAVGPDGTLAFYSSWGKQLAISAPGGDKQKGGDAGAILQNTIIPGDVEKTDRYLAFQGTSMATPHVAAAAALIMSAGVTNPDKVEEILKSTAKDAGARGWDEKYGNGILDAGAAVERAKSKTAGPVHLLSALALLPFFLRRLRTRVGLGLIVGTVMGASGLFFLQGTFVEEIPVLGTLAATAAPNLDLLAFGAEGFRTALWASALPAVGLVALFLGMPRAKGFLAGLCFGWAVHFLISSLSLSADVQWIPGLASFFDRGWLLINALILLVLSALVVRTLSKKSA